ncbi:hypothetical protein KR222_001124, partial [Zaprionus bogoriensis]
NMSEVQNLLDDLTKTFVKFRCQRRAELINLFSQVQCCECGHKMRIQKAKMAAQKSGNQLKKLVIGCFAFLIVLTIYWLHLARRYNHLKAYGNGACVTTFFYSYSDCEILI